jgi:hypothetical protein
MFSLNIRDQVSHPYRTTGKIIVLSFQWEQNKKLSHVDVDVDDGVAPTDLSTATYDETFLKYAEFQVN